MGNEQNIKITGGISYGSIPDSMREGSFDSSTATFQSSGDFDADASRLGDNKASPKGNGVRQLRNMSNSQLTLENINSILIDRLDKNVTLQTEILSRLEKMIVVQEEKIDQQERLGANLVKMMEDRRLDADRKFDDQNKKVVEVEKTIGVTLVAHLSELRTDQNTRHKEFAEQQKTQLKEFTNSLEKINEKTDDRITKIERVIYAILGISGVGALFFEYVLPIIHR